MARTKYFHADEVAELLNSTTSEVYSLLKDGTLRGYKNRGRWLIDMDQPYLNKSRPKQQLEENEIGAKTECDISYKYVRDSEHYDVLYEEMVNVKSSLYIATADFKGVRLHEVND